MITMLQTTFQNIEESLNQLPYSLQVEVFHYIEFLKSNYAKQSIEDSEVKRPKKRDGFGIWQGKISMSEDFDAPIVEFEELPKSA